MNTSHDTSVAISNFLGVSGHIGSGKYLGLPSMVGHSKKAIFSYLKDRIWKKNVNFGMLDHSPVSVKKF